MNVRQLVNETRLAVYSTLQRRLPASVRGWVGRSSLTETLRSWLLWPGGMGLAETDVRFHGAQFRYGAPVKDIAAIRRVGGIENGLCRLVLQECGPGAVAIDVGANYGFVTMVMCCAVGRTGQVHSFEADATIVASTRANVQRNGFEDRCTLTHAFVGNVADDAGHVTVDAHVAAHGIERVDFLKVDVDGPDLQVLEGARRTLERFHPVVVVEMTGDQPAIFALLRDLGYDCTDMQGRPVDPAAWPANLLAARGRHLKVPARIALTERVPRRDSSST